MPNRTGRRTKCTPGLKEEICEVLREGNFIKVACDCVGIDESTYYKWVARGREELKRVEEDGRRSVRKIEQPFVEFFQSVTYARAESERQSVARVRRAAEEDWRADAWFLEHSFPDRWGRRRQEVDITTGGDKIEGPVVYLPAQKEEHGDRD